MYSAVMFAVLAKACYAGATCRRRGEHELRDAREAVGIMQALRAVVSACGSGAASGARQKASGRLCRRQRRQARCRAGDAMRYVGAKRVLFAIGTVAMFIAQE